MNPDAMKFLQGLAEACNIFMKYADHVEESGLSDALFVKIVRDKVVVADNSRLEHLGWEYDTTDGVYFFEL